MISNNEKMIHNCVCGGWVRVWE